jgi:chromosome segregation ATPase
MSRSGVKRSGPVPETLTEEIESLRRQRAELLEERNALRVRIATMTRESDHSLQTVSPRILSQLEREHRELQRLVESQREELQALKLSDSAALRHELQEEIKIVYMELMRLEQYQAAQQQELRDLQRDREELARQEAPEAMDKQERKVHAYQEKLAKYEHANRKLSAKIRTMRADRAFDTDEGREQIRVRAEELRAEIARVQAETAEIQRAIDASVENHRAEMRALRGKPQPEKHRS